MEYSVCQYCIRVFSVDQEDTYQNHVAKHQNFSNYYCGVCDKICAKISNHNASLRHIVQEGQYRLRNYTSGGVRRPSDDNGKDAQHDADQDEDDGDGDDNMPELMHDDDDDDDDDDADDEIDDTELVQRDGGEDVLPPLIPPHDAEDDEEEVFALHTSQPTFALHYPFEDPEAYSPSRSSKWYSNAMLLAICREEHLSESTTERLLRLIRHPDFRPADISGSVYFLKKLEDVHVPLQRLWEASLPSGGKFYFYHPLAVLQHILLSRDDIDRFTWEWSSNNGRIAHAFSSDGVLELFAMCYPQIRDGYKLLLCRIFLDAFDMQSSKALSTYAIIMEIVNQDAPATLAIKSKALLSLVPATAKVHEVMDILLKLVKPLETGLEMRVGSNHRVERFIGTVHAAIGDYPQQAELRATVGAAGNSCCGRCTVDIANEDLTVLRAPGPQDDRNPATHKEIIESVIEIRDSGDVGSSTAAQSLLTKVDQ